jgi:hypothetical protein
MKGAAAPRIQISLGHNAKPELQPIRNGSHTKRRTSMKIKVANNVAIFVLFFGVAFLEELQTGNWLKALFWLAIGFVFLAADNPEVRADRRMT